MLGESVQLERNRSFVVLTPLTKAKRNWWISFTLASKAEASTVLRPPKEDDFYPPVSRLRRQGTQGNHKALHIHIRIVNTQCPLISTTTCNRGTKEGTGFGSAALLEP